MSYLHRSCKLDIFLDPKCILHSDDNINILHLICKAVLGYLYYQLIVSLRQDTRRK